MMMSEEVDTDALVKLGKDVAAERMAEEVAARTGMDAEVAAVLVDGLIGERELDSELLKEVAQKALVEAAAEEMGQRTGTDPAQWKAAMNNVVDSDSGSRGEAALAAAKTVAVNLAARKVAEQTGVDEELLKGQIGALLEGGNSQVSTAQLEVAVKREAVRLVAIEAAKQSGIDQSVMEEQLGRLLEGKQVDKGSIYEAVSDVMADHVARGLSDQTGVDADELRAHLDVALDGEKGKVDWKSVREAVEETALDAVAEEVSERTGLDQQMVKEELEAAAIGRREVEWTRVGDAAKEAAKERAVQEIVARTGLDEGVVRKGLDKGLDVVSDQNEVKRVASEYIAQQTGMDGQLVADVLEAALGSEKTVDWEGVQEEAARASKAAMLKRGVKEVSERTGMDADVVREEMEAALDEHREVNWERVRGETGRMAKEMLVERLVEEAGLSKGDAGQAVDKAVEKAKDWLRQGGDPKEIEEESGLALTGAQKDLRTCVRESLAQDQEQVKAHQGTPSALDEVID
jgi:hypothetical protein